MCVRLVITAPTCKADESFPVISLKVTGFVYRKQTENSSGGIGSTLDNWKHHYLTQTCIL